MIRYYGYKGERKHTICFYSPEGDGSGGGGGGGATGASDEVKTPFDDIAVDELGPTERAAIESGKLQFRTLMANQKGLETRLGQQEILTRRFQSDADKSKAELNRIFGHGATGATGTTGDTEVSQVVKDALKSAGYKDQDIERLGPMFSTMLQQVGAIQKKDIGQHLQPMAAKVIENDATSAFNLAKDTSPMGSLQIPEVAEKVWTYIQERTKAGQATTVEIIHNLSKMALIDHMDTEAKAGREVKLPEFAGATGATGMTQQTTRFTYPGSGTPRPAVRHTVPATGGASQLNSDTEAALATTFKSMTSGLQNKDGGQITPKALEGKAGVGGRR